MRTTPPTPSTTVSRPPALMQVLSRLTITLLLIGAVVIGLLPMQTPSPSKLDAPLEHFSAARAMTHLREIAKEPPLSDVCSGYE